MDLYNKIILDRLCEYKIVTINIGKLFVIFFNHGKKYYFT